MIDVSIVIVNYNTKDILRNCLSSVYTQTRDIIYELIVVDNASSDGSVKMIEKEFPQVTLIKNKDNHGFAAGNNQGIRVSGGRYVLLLNPDTIVLEGAIQKTVAYADNHLNIGVLGCQVWLNENEIQKTCFPFPSIYALCLQQTGLYRMFPKSRIFGGADYGWWDRKSQMDVDVVSGMFMLVRREAIGQVGLMDEAYFVYAEETDWCFRFWKAGWRCVFWPGARIIHLDGGSKSTNLVKNKMFVQMQKSILTFYLKQYGILSWGAAKVIYSFAMSMRYAVFSVLSSFKRGDNYSIKASQSKAAIKFHLLGSEPNNGTNAK